MMMMLIMMIMKTNIERVIGIMLITAIVFVKTEMVLDINNSVELN